MHPSQLGGEPYETSFEMRKVKRSIFRPSWSGPFKTLFGVLHGR